MVPDTVLPSRIIRAAVLLVLLFCATLIGLDSRTPAIFPDTLAPLYQDWDFRIRSARLTGDIHALERQHLWLVKTRPLDPAVRWQLVELYAGCGMTNKLRTAAAGYRALLARSLPWQWNAWNLWFAAARSHDLSGEDEKALELYRRSLAHGATAHACNRIMEIELKRGRFSEALDACRRWGILAGFGVSERERLVGQCHERAGMQEEARAAFLRALQANPLDLLSLESLARVGTAEAILVRQAVRAVAVSGYNLDYLNNVIEACIRANRADAARLVVRELSAWFSARRSLYWCLAAARADEAAGHYLDAAMHFRQARLWRSTASAEETSYYLEREIGLLVTAGRTLEAATLYGVQGGVLGREARVCLELRMMQATNAPAALKEGLLVGHAAGEQGDWANLSAAFLERIALVLGPFDLRETLARLWRLSLSRQTDPVSMYAAGKFFLARGLPAEAIGWLHRAREGMRAMGQVSVEIEGAARMLGLSEDAAWHNARARYLLGHEGYNSERTLMVQRLRREVREAVP